MAAHPDDESIGLGGLLPYLPHATVVHVTDGAPHRREWWGAPELPSREAYAQARRGELIAALTLAGVGENRLRSLGVADQEASVDLARLAHQMAGVITELHCDVVFTHSYEGGHPDHDATAFAVHAACRMLRRNGDDAPQIIEFAGYHAQPAGGLTRCDFLPVPQVEETTVVLDEAEQDLKRRMLAAFVTQRETLAPFPIDVERFRRAPAYDFTAPPHKGELHYERFDWGCAGAEWRARASEGMRILRIDSGAQDGDCPILTA